MSKVEKLAGLEFNWFNWFNWFNSKGSFLAGLALGAKGFFGS